MSTMQARKHRYLFCSFIGASCTVPYSSIAELATERRRRGQLDADVHRTLHAGIKHEKGQDIYSKRAAGQTESAKLDCSMPTSTLFSG